MNCKDGKNGWTPSDQIGGPCINQNTGYDGGNNEYDEECLFWIYSESGQGNWLVCETGWYILPLAKVDYKGRMVKHEVDFGFVHVKLEEEEKHPSSDVPQGLEIQDRPQMEIPSNKISWVITNLETIVKTTEDCPIYNGF